MVLSSQEVIVGGVGGRLCNVGSGRGDGRRLLRLAAAAAAAAAASAVRLRTTLVAIHTR